MNEAQFSEYHKGWMQANNELCTFPAEELYLGAIPYSWSDERFDGYRDRLEQERFSMYGDIFA